MALRYDPDWVAHAKPILDLRATRLQPPAHDITTRRAEIKFLYAQLSKNVTLVDNVVKEVYDVTSYDGALIKLYQYTPKDLPKSPGAAVLNIHGGGMIAGEALLGEALTRKKAAEAGLQYFDVEYRLAPEHPHPAPVEDAYAALAWISAHATELNVDPARIGVEGGSAGGGIAAGVSLIARDRKLQPPIAKMILTYPMLDYKNVQPVSPALSKYLVWTEESNLTGWVALLGEEAMRSGKVSPYASPLHAEDLSGLPPTFMDLGGLDLFRDEDIKYAGRLLAADIPVELHVYPGVPHAFEALAPEANVTQTALANRLKALRSF